MLLLACLASCLPQAARAAGEFRVSGGLSINSDFYAQSGLAEDRRPGSVLSITGDLTFTLLNRFSIPLSVFLSSEDAGFRLPLNQLGSGLSLRPQWGPVQINTGYFSPSYSEFTVNDTRVLGGGLEMNPGIFRIGVSGGVSQQSVEPSETSPGLFRQYLGALQFGVGTATGKHIWLTGARIADDEGSIAVSGDSTAFRPKENFTAGLKFGVPFAERKVILDGEVAGSAFSDNTFADELSDSEVGTPSFTKSFFTPRESSRIDVATRANLQIKTHRTWSVRVLGKYVGPGYKSLGATQVQADVLEAKITPDLRIGRFNGSVGLGLRENNVAGTRAFTTRRTGLDANAYYQFTNSIGASGMFAYLNVRGPSDNDSLNVDNTNLIFNLTPTVQFGVGTTRNALSVSYNYQEFVDDNLILGFGADTQNYSLVGSHTLSFMSGMSFTTSAAWVLSKTFRFDTNVFTLSENVGQSFMNRKLRANLLATLNRTTTTSVETGVTGQLQLSYQVGRPHRIEGRVEVRHFDRPTDLGQPDFTELTARLGYKLSL